MGRCPVASDLRLSRSPTPGVRLTTLAAASAVALCLGGCSTGGGPTPVAAAMAPAVAPPAADGLTPAQRAEIEAAVAAYRAANLKAPAGASPLGPPLPDASASRVPAEPRLEPAPPEVARETEPEPPTASASGERVAWLDPGGTGAAWPPADVPPAATPPATPPAEQAPGETAAPPLPPLPPDAGTPFATPTAAPDTLVPTVARPEVADVPSPPGLASGDAPASTPGLVEISALELCRSVGGFGVYEPFPDNTFAAGAPVRMVLYAEIDGFATDVAGGEARTMHKVRLSQEVLLFRDADGEMVWQRASEAIEDESRRVRRDFWSVQLVELPATLGVGRYRLKVRITDEVSGTVDERSVPLRLVAGEG